MEIARGSGGATLSKPLNKITFLAIYKAVECIDNGQLFHFHENPNPSCPVGGNIHSVLDDKLAQVQKAMEQQLQSITLADVSNDIKKCIS